MRILILDTIHGGKVIADHLLSQHHMVDMVDVYRHIDGISENQAADRGYDLISAPVHLDPDHPLLRTLVAPTISHHAMVRSLLGRMPGGPVIEITGKQGKSTTAQALAFLLSGSGILHTSSGLIRYPEKTVLGRHSITPASLLTISGLLPDDAWLIAEISLGFCGIGTLGILTSGEDYLVGSGKRSAFSLKSDSSHLLQRILVPPGVSLTHDGCVHADDLVRIEGTRAFYQYHDMQGAFTNSLLPLPGYQVPLILAASAALLLGIDPAPLSSFKALPGRMEVTEDSGFIIVDNSNSGSCLQTTCDAFRYGASLAGNSGISLIIGQESASVCENFPTEEICTAILTIRPDYVVLIPGDGRIEPDMIHKVCDDVSARISLAMTTDEAITLVKTQQNSLILLSVKRWK